MPILPIYRAQRAIALHEFPDLVVGAYIIDSPSGDPLKLRLDLADDSLLDVFVSGGGRYSYHWQRSLAPGHELYRHDNAPHHRWRHVVTFPKHFHDGSEANVIESHISDAPEKAIAEFLTFVRHKLLGHP
jgi:hypothetical protein